MSKKEVLYSFAIGGALSSSFKAAVTGAKSEFTGLAQKLQELENSDINRLGTQFARQKEHIRSLGTELTTAKEKLRLLQAQSKGAGKDTKIFELQVKEAEKEVSSLTYALEKNIAGYQKNIAQIRNTQGSVRSLASEYVKLSQEMEKTQGVQNRFKALQTQRDNLTSARSAIQGQMVQTAVPALALSVPLKQAVEFEAAMADVAKTMDGMRDDDGNLTAKYYAMEQAVKNMAREIPLSHEEIAGLFAAAGQQGLSELSEIQEFVTMSAQMAVAFGVSQEQAADAIGGYRAALGLSFEETRSMLDLMNQFANTSSATEQDIAEVVKRVGALGQQAGVSVTAMAAMTKNLVAMKVPPEVAATGIKNFLLALTAGEAATTRQSETFKKLGFDTVSLAEAMQKDAPNAIQKLLSSIKKLPEAERLSTLNQLFGTESITSISSFDLEKLAEDLTLVNDTTKYAGAMQKEFEARNQTTAASLQKFQNKVKEASINIGSALLPALNSAMDGIGPFVSGFADFAENNPALMKAVVGTAGALVGLKLAALTGMLTVNALRRAVAAGQMVKLGYMVATRKTTLSLAAEKVAMLASAGASNATTASLAVQKTAMLSATGATRSVTAAQWGLNVAMTANPIGLIVTGLGMAAAAMYALYQTCEPVRNAFDWVFGGIAGLIQSLWEKLKMLWGAAKKIGQTLGLIDDDAEVKLSTTLTAQSSGISSAAGAVSNPMPVFPAAFAAQDFVSSDTVQNVSNAQNMQISVPMQFTVQGLDEREFIRQMENARPDIEEIIKKVMEKVQHQKARINFAN